MNARSSVDSSAITCYMIAMHNTDRDFWNGELNLMRMVFFFARRAEMFHQKGWLEKAESADIDTVNYLNHALDKTDET